MNDDTYFGWKFIYSFINTIYTVEENLFFFFTEQTSTVTSITSTEEQLSSRFTSITSTEEQSSSRFTQNILYLLTISSLFKLQSHLIATTPHTSNNTTALPTVHVQCSNRALTMAHAAIFPPLTMITTVHVSLISMVAGVNLIIVFVIYTLAGPMVYASLLSANEQTDWASFSF